MAKPLTTTSYAILGLLRLRSWTPYELAKQVQKSLGWFWPRAERKLYDEPKNLVALGLATATEEHTGNRPRTVYAITPAGRKALRGWLGHTPEPPALEFEGMVKVFFADGGTIEQLRETLDSIERTARGTRRRAAGHDRRRPHALVRVHVSVADQRARSPIRARPRRSDRRVGRVGAEQVATWHSPSDAGDWDWEAALS